MDTNSEFLFAAYDDTRRIFIRRSDATQISTQTQAWIEENGEPHVGEPEIFLSFLRFGEFEFSDELVELLSGNHNRN